MSHVLAGDIGGTNARFAIFDRKSDGAPSLVCSEVLESRSYKSFESAMGAFLDHAAKVAKSKKKLTLAAASLAIAGPVVDQRVKTTNLPWHIDARTIGKRFAIANVTLLNDLVAVGLGALASSPKHQVVLQVGRPKKAGGNLAVIAAGTGLGEATFVWDGQEHIACATEGGHTDFAPRSAVEDELLAHLRAEHGRVSYERIASGSTICLVYRFFVEQQKVKEAKGNAALVEQAPDPNRAVVELARAGKSEAAMRAIDLWCSVYGSEAGNLALKSLSTAGVFVCGGVAASLADVLAKGLPARAGKRGFETSPFLAAFRDKGRMRPLVEGIPVAVCTEPRAGLLGAATHAASRA